MTDHPMIQMNDGRRIPQLGFGVFLIPDEQVEPALREAFAAGYRSIDTAALYGNEEGVGRAIASSGLRREELFVTTKVWNDLREQGLARSIGVSNFTPAHLRRLMDETDVVPAVNQIELHPRLQQRELRDFHAAHGIVTESWSPLARSELLDDEVIAQIARKHSRSPAQVILRWHLENGFVTIPKSVTPSRIRENIDVFDFQLDAEDMAKIERLDTPGGRIGPDPETMG
jgi:2,5-diketo-D-gluconate reductase A